MRDNAKASSDRSSFGRGALLGLFGRAFATRSASCEGQGSGAPSRRRARPPLVSLAVALLGAVGLLALWSASASAARVHPYLTSFGSFSYVQGVATDSAGDVYVYDTGASKILKFDASGSPVNFSATGTNEITGVSGGGTDENELAVDNSASGPAKGDIYVATGSTAHVLIFSAAGSQIGELTGAGSGPWSGEKCGVAVDPSGNVYVGMYGGYVDKFVPSANPVANTDYASAISGLSSPCNVAVDSAGNVFTDTWSSGPVTRYEASQFGSLSPTGSVVDSAGSTLAVDPANDEVYVDEKSQIAQFGAHGEPFEAPVTTFASSGSGAISGSFGISVSGFNHDVYVSNGQGQISVFGPLEVLSDVTTLAASSLTSEGTTLNGTVNPDKIEVTECTFEYGQTVSYGKTASCAETVGAGSLPVSVHADLSKLGEFTTYHFRLVATNAEDHSAAGADQTFTTLGPGVSNAMLNEAGSTFAAVSALVNPDNAATTYHVEYGETASYGQSTTESAPGAPSGSYAVKTTIAGLKPATTYHFRFVVTNPDGSAASADGELRTYPVEQAEKGCANEARRAEQGATALPECRAYEMVTPSSKGSGEPNATAYLNEPEYEPEPLRSGGLDGIYGARAGIGGERMAWVSQPLPGASAPGPSHLSTRGAGGWSSEELVPPMSPANEVLCPVQLGVSGWSSDLSKAILDLPAGPPASNAVATRGFVGEEECGHDEPRLVPGEPEHFHNLFFHDNLGGSNLLVNLTPAGITWPEPEENSQIYWPASFLAGSDDLSHVVFEEELKLTPDAPIGYRGGDELYEWTGGQVHLVTILPDGTPVHGSLAGATRNYSSEPGHKGVNIAQFRHAVSSSGSRVFFEAEGNLYLREDGARTVQIDAAEAGAPGPSGGGKFQVANAEGTRVFFTDESRLTADSTAVSGKPDLYEYDAGSGALTDLTVDGTEPASVLGVSGASEDGAYVYFVATGDITGAQQNSQGAEAQAGEPNLYLRHNGATTFVATLEPSADRCDWTPIGNCSGGESFGPTARVSANGAFLAFNSVRSLTGYDNTDVNTGEADIEIYLYDAAAHRLSCASCTPSGVPPRAGAAIKSPVIPGQNASWKNTYPQRNVSDRGQVFFETTDALVPRDVNGRRDVYEYANGTVRLLSTGTSEAGSHFLDATPNGSDVFISTAQRLLPRDTDSIYDYYDVREGGGFAEPAPPAPPCEGEGCKGAAAGTPTFGAPGSLAFSGPGNLPAPVSKKPAVKRLTNAQKLARALKECKRKPKRRRAHCRAQARKRYGPKKARKSTNRRAAQ